MGIRFWCPNGHKLNVKGFQAGRRGICPYCGARFMIPNESTRRTGTGDRTPEPLEHSVHEGGFTTPPAAGPVAGERGFPSAPVGWESPGTAGASAPGQSAPFEYAAGPAPSAPQATGREATPAAASSPAAPLGASAPVAAGPASPGADFAAGPQPAFQSLPLGPASPTFGSAPAAPASGGPDPLAEAPDAVWYVRPPTGGQFGPATADVMRNWITEGRVSPDSLVWREGWRDWQEAGGVFAALGAGPTAGIVVPTASAPPTARSPAGKRSTASPALIIIVLVLAVLVLLGVFLYVAFGQKGPKPAPPKSAAGVETPSDLRSPADFGGRNDNLAPRRTA